MKIFEIEDTSKMQGDLFTNFDKPTSFNVLINGKVWCKDGEPMVFRSDGDARRAANAVSKKYNKITQVVPAGKIPPSTRTRRRR
jgi:hypothetical protein